MIVLAQRLDEEIDRGLVSKPVFFFVYRWSFTLGVVNSKLTGYRMWEFTYLLLPTLFKMQRVYLLFLISHYVAILDLFWIV